MKRRKKAIEERGITLISLVVIVVLLVILASVTIKTMSGQDSIIDASIKATEEYNIVQYREEIEALIENIVLREELLGRNIELKELAKEMTKETTWIKSAVANISESESERETNEDIILTTKEGYIFQIYYNEGYGQTFIEYIGKEDGKTIPKVVAEYNKTSNKIEVIKATDVSGIKSIELIYKGELVTESKTERLEYEITKTGWYIVKVTTNNEKIRYAWVRGWGTIIAPKIEIINPSINPASGWYKEKVKIRISEEEGNTSKIYYTLNRWKESPILTIEESEKIEVNGKSIIGKEIEINKQGITSIYAYSVDKNMGESEITRYNVLIDNEKPKVNTPEIIGIRGENRVV